MLETVTTAVRVSPEKVLGCFNKIFLEESIPAAWKKEKLYS